MLGRIADAVFPYDYTCELCGTETFGEYLCADCLSKVFFNDGTVCPVCGRRTERSEICRDCKQKTPEYDAGVSALVYEGGAVSLMAGFKNGRPYLCRFFGEITSERAQKLPHPDAVTYIPVTKERLKSRGYNQSLLLAYEVAARLGVPCLDLLEKVKDTPEQKSLTRSERADNLKSCFRVTDRLQCKGRSILVVDDVLTTGATADAAAVKLRSAGAKQVFLATVASVEYSAKPSASTIKR